MGLLFKNNAETTLSSGINNSVTTVPVASAAVFPTPTANDVFFATIDDGSSVEVVKVTGISSNDLTVVRAQDNTSAAAFGAGAKVELRLTAKILEMGTSSLTDLDGDTKIEVETTADSDTIILTANGGDYNFVNSSNTIAIIKTDNNDFTIQNNLNDKDFILKGYDSDGGGLITALSIDYSDQGNATFNKNVIFADNGKALFGAGTDLAIFSDGTDGKIQATGSLILDADGTTISLRDGGTENSQIGLDSAGLVLTVVGADKDFFVSGDDGGTAITAFRADMSDAGRILAYGGVSIEANADMTLGNGTWSGEKTAKIQAHSGHTYYQRDSHIFRTQAGTNLSLIHI